MSSAEHSNNRKKKAIPTTMVQSVEDAQINIILDDCLKELQQVDERHKAAKRIIILKYAAQLEEIVKRKQDIGINLIAGLRQKGYRIDKSYVYKTLGKEYCRGFEKYSIESGREHPERERLTITPTPLSDDDYKAATIIEQMRNKIEGLEAENKDLKRQIDIMRSESGFKWFSSPLSFVEKQVNRYKEQKLDKIWFIAEEGYVVNIVDREPKDQNEAESMI